MGGSSLSPNYQVNILVLLLEAEVITWSPGCWTLSSLMLTYVSTPPICKRTVFQVSKAFLEKRRIPARSCL